MGTNYYLKRVPTEADCQKMHQMIDNREFGLLRKEIGKLGSLIHVGKFSYGWQFTFQIDGLQEGVERPLNMKDLELTRENAIKRIQEYMNEGHELVDEGGGELSLEEFKRMVDMASHVKNDELGDDQVMRDGARWMYVWFC